MKILITGGTGLLGKSLIECAQTEDEIFATYIGDYDIKNSPRVRYDKLDIRDKEGYGELFKAFKPDVAIHTAGINSPDYAQQNQEEAWGVNVSGTENIIRACEKYGVNFIYISSNGIYDGEKAPYSEEMEAAPVNYYGKIKLEGERITKRSRLKWAIVRPILMYGWNYAFERANVITWALAELKKRKKIFVYSDVYSTALFAYACAGAIWKIIKEDKYEIFNIGGGNRLSVYELVKEAAGIFGLDRNLIMPVQQGYFKEMVRRPKDTSYDTAKMERALGIKPLPVREGLEAMKVQKMTIKCPDL